MELAIPMLGFHLVYHQERCIWCGQLNAKYSGELSITIDKLVQEESFFSGFIQTKDFNIHCFSTHSKMGICGYVSLQTRMYSVHGHGRIEFIKPFIKTYDITHTADKRQVNLQIYSYNAIYRITLSIENTYQWCMWNWYWKTRKNKTK